MVDDLKIVVNLYYEPTLQLLDILDRNKDIYFPINGGSTLEGKAGYSSILMDSAGDNISSKNRLYNEMTSIYWFWKNYPIDSLEYIGFNHYRRFFKREDFIADYHDYDIVVANPLKQGLAYTLLEQYYHYHEIEDLKKMAALLFHINKNIGLAFMYYMMNLHYMLAPCNMFIMKRDLFKQWCSFLFTVMPILEKLICSSSEFKARDNYNKRALCFLCERLFGWWYSVLLTKGCKTKAIDIVEYADFKPEHVDEREDYSISSKA